MIFESKLVLDTCALIWLVGGTNDISPETLQKIEDASIVYVSAISAWEISLKESQGQLTLPMDAEEWFLKSVQNHDLTVAPLGIDILCRSTNLPAYHKDPADRFIIATAQKLKAGIVTADRLFSNYDVRVYI